MKKTVRKLLSMVLVTTITAASVLTFWAGQGIHADAANQESSRIISEEKDAEDYTPAKDAVSGGQWEMLPSGERTYVLKDGTQAKGTWVEDGGDYYYIDHTGCLMKGNYSEEGFWVNDSGIWDQTSERLREVVAPLSDRVYGENPCWTFEYEKDDNDVWTVHVKKTYGFGTEELFIMSPIGRSIYKLTDDYDRVAAQMSVSPDRSLLLITEAGSTSRYEIQGEKPGTDMEEAETEEVQDKPVTEEIPAEENDVREREVIKEENDGYELTLFTDVMGSSPSIDAAAVPESELKGFMESSGFEIVSDVVDISSDEYDGSILGDGIVLTLDLPEEVTDPRAELERYYAGYFNEETGNVEFLVPDYINIDEGTMTVTVPHLSKYGAVKLEDEKEIEAFLDSYCTKQAVAESYEQKSASELEPYLNAKLDALKLSGDMKKELIKALVSDLAGSYTYTTTDGDEVEELGKIRDLSMELYNASQGESSEDAFMRHMDELVLLEFKKVLGIYDKEYKEKVSSAAGKLIEYGGAAGTIAGALSEGDIEGAMQEASTLMQNAIPFGSSIKSAAGYVGSLVNEEFTNWKANEVEALYQVYKNGKRGLLGSPSVEAGNEEEFLEFLNYTGLFQNTNGIMRFYRLDKIEETCRKYGWSFKTYEEMDEHYKDIFTRRAEEGLMNYFRTRSAQEKRAEEIKKEEEDCIRDMLNRETGALVSCNYQRFFKETIVDGKSTYSLTDRLERLMRVRQIISRYVDEEAYRKQLGKGYESVTYGFLLNSWITLVLEYGHNEAEKRFCAILEEYGLLNPFYRDFAREGKELAEAEEAGNSGKDSSPDKQDGKQSVPAGEWRLYRTIVDKGVYDKKDSAYSLTFSASELVHTKIEKYIGPETEEEHHQTSVLQTTCTPMPWVIRPGDTLSVRLTAAVLSTDRTEWNFDIQSAVNIHFESPENEGKKPEGNGEYLLCDADDGKRDYQVGAHVKGEDGSMRGSGIYFYDISASEAGKALSVQFWDWNGESCTTWIYLWNEY